VLCEYTRKSQRVSILLHALLYQVHVLAHNYDTFGKIRKTLKEIMQVIWCEFQCFYKCMVYGLLLLIQLQNQQTVYTQQSTAEITKRSIVEIKNSGFVIIIALHLSNYSHTVNMLRSSQHYLTHRHLHLLHLILSFSEYLHL